MRSQDRVSEKPEVDENFPDFEEECNKDMWSLIISEPRSEAFSALLPGNNGGKEFKDNIRKPSWDLAPPKAYVPIARSRSSLSSDSLQLCTEGLGCESCDCLTDSSSSESSSVILDDFPSEDEDEEEDIDCEVEEENIEREEKIFPVALPARSFPPPLPSLCASNASFMRSVKKDGRFVLQSVKMPTQNYLQSFRQGGRLKMQLIRAEDDFVLPQSSTEIKPENEIVDKEVDGGGGGSDSDDIIQKILHEEVDGGGGSDSEEIDSCFIDKFPILEEKISDNSEVQESEDNLPKIPDAVSIPGEICKGCEIQTQNAGAEFKGAFHPQGCKINDNNKCGAVKSVENHEISDIISSPKTGHACFNVYNGWRTEIAEQNSSIFCHNWQKAQCLPNYPLNKSKYGEAYNNVDLNVNVNESCVHVKVRKFRLNDLGLGRCHAPKSFSVWCKSQCIATNS